MTSYVGSISSRVGGNEPALRTPKALLGEPEKTGLERAAETEPTSYTVWESFTVRYRGIRHRLRRPAQTYVYYIHPVADTTSSLSHVPT